MRYNDVDTIIFTDINGDSYQVKDVREISDQTINFEIDVIEIDMIDEITSRREIYGDNAEFQSYKIFDANIVILTENNFILTNIKKLKIPL